MKIIISGKKLELTEGIKTAIEDKLGKLERYLNPETEVKVTVSAKKATQKIEVTIIPISGPIIRAEDSEENLYAAIDVVYDKLKKQIRRYKNKLQDRHQCLCNDGRKANRIDFFYNACIRLHVFPRAILLDRRKMPSSCHQLCQHRQYRRCRLFVRWHPDRPW